MWVLLLDEGSEEGRQVGMVVESRAGFVFLPYVYYEYGIAIGVVVWKIRSCIRNCLFIVLLLFLEYITLYYTGTSGLPSCVSDVMKFSYVVCFVLLLLQLCRRLIDDTK